MFRTANILSIFSRRAFSTKQTIADKMTPHFLPLPYTSVTWSGTYRHQPVSISLKDLTFVVLPADHEVLFKYKLSAELKGVPHQGFHDAAAPIWMNVSLWRQNTLLYDFGRVISEGLLNYNNMLNKGTFSAPQEIWCRFKNNKTPPHIATAAVKLLFPGEISFFKETLILKASKENAPLQKPKHRIDDVLDDDYFNAMNRYYHRP